MTKSRKQHGAMFEPPESASPEQETVLKMLEVVSEKLERARKPCLVGVDELDLEELRDMLTAGANPQVAFEADLTQMAIRAAECSRAACRAALLLLDSISRQSGHNGDNC